MSVRCCRSSPPPQARVLWWARSAARPSGSLEREDVLATAHGEMTTAELVDCERRLIAAAVGRAGEGSGIVDASHVERAIAAADRPLTDEQAAAVRTAVSIGPRGDRHPGARRHGQDLHRGRAAPGL